jgi:F0F1-type ATP synthase assembly protein I
MDSSALQPYLDRVPMAGQLAMLILVAVGLTLWILGRRLARPICAISGLAIGGFLALVLSQALGDRAKLLIWVIIGCLAGATVGWLLFRVFMSISLSVLLALLLPAAVVFWNQQLSEAPAKDGESTEWVAPRTRDLTQSDAINRVQAQLADRYEQAREDVIQWWSDQPARRRQAMAVAASVGALGGLVLGVAAPYVAASLASALIGSLLVLGASARFLSGLDAVPDWMPTHPAVHLIALGLITLLGVLVQWTIFRATADK